MHGSEDERLRYNQNFMYGEKNCLLHRYLKRQHIWRICGVRAVNKCLLAYFVGLYQFLKFCTIIDSLFYQLMKMIKFITVRRKHILGDTFLKLHNGLDVKKHLKVTFIGEASC